MSKLIINFEVENYDKTRLKIKSTYTAIPKITDGVVLVNDKLIEITDDFRILTTQLLTSSDFTNKCNEITTTSYNIAEALKSSMISLMNDTFDRIKNVEDNSQAYKDDLAEAEKALNNSLEKISGLKEVTTSQSFMDNGSSVSIASNMPNENEDLSIASVESDTDTPVALDNKNASLDEQRNLLEESSSDISSSGLDPHRNLLDGVTDDTSGATYESRDVTGTLSPGTEAHTFDAPAYELSDEEFRQFAATVYAEASERPEYVDSDTLAVASTMLNRADNWGQSVQQVISAPGQFSGYQNSKYYRAYNNLDVISPEQMNAIKTVLGGQRNTNAMYFYGDGKQNHFRVNY